MRLHRFIGAFDLTKNEAEISDFQIIKQIRAVLRLEIGDKILLSDGKGKEAEVTLTFITNDLVKGTIDEVRNTEVDDRKVTLYLAILKKENFELSVQKATEAGVARIVPVITERTVKTGLNTERLEKIIREASEQCGRSIIPTLSPTMDYKGALSDGSSAEEKIIFHLVDTEYKPKDSMTVSIFIGPEGGFSENEIQAAESAGYFPASLGSLTFRGETAAIIATYRAVKGV